MKKVWIACCAVFVFVNWQCRRTDQVFTPLPERPNIIFLLADDMRFDALGCTGNKVALTQNLDDLAAQGSNFKNSYVTTAICAISRASLLTGQYAKRHGIDNFNKDLTQKALKETYPALLRDHGYFTGFIGKYGVGTNLPSFAFDYWKGYPGQGVYFYRDASGNMVHETALMGQQAKEFIANRDRSKPFCLSVSFKAPHSEEGTTENNGFRSDPYFDSWYTNVQFPYPETYQGYFSRFPAAWRRSTNGILNEGRDRWDFRFSTPEKFQTSYHAIYRLVSGVDKVIGELRDYLQTNGLDKNTIIVFSSDNGYYMGEHGLEGKWYGHEESIRVPLIIYNPRMPTQKKIVEEIALNIDVAPTILSWAGVAVPNKMQGKPLQSLLLGDNTNWRRDFFYEHPYESGAGVYIPKSVGLVTPAWKYIRYYNGPNSTSNVVYEELYDAKTDPHEKLNRAKDADQQGRLAAYKRRVSQYEMMLY